MIQWVTKEVNNRLCYINVKDSNEQLSNGSAKKQTKKRQHNDKD